MVYICVVFAVNVGIFKVFIVPQQIHMAGIIPVAGLETDFDQQLPEVMMPGNATHPIWSVAATTRLVEVAISTGRKFQ